MVKRSLSQETAAVPKRTRRLLRPTTGAWMGRLVAVCAGVLLGVLIFDWWEGTRPTHTVTIQVNGGVQVVQSHHSTVDGVLREQGYALTPLDIVYPPRQTRLPLKQPVHLILARDLTLITDGDYRRFLTHATHVGDLLLEQGITLRRSDTLLLDGNPLASDGELQFHTGEDGRPRGEIVVERSVPVIVEDEAGRARLTTREHTVGEMLLAHGVVLHEGDRVTPALSHRIEPGLRVRIERTTPFVLTADGDSISSRTDAATVGELLAEQGVALRELDRVSHSLDAPVENHSAIRVTRVDHQRIVERDPIPYDSYWMARDDWELDTVGLAQAGEEGVFARETLVVYEDGEETERILQHEYVERPPQDEVYAYGTKIVVRTINTAQGPRQYWRRIRMHATSYTAATSGKSRDHPEYGITRTGIRAGFGIVAVDPRVVALRSSVYVPGYGIGYAGDTGGAIKGKRIDLGYDEHNLILWYQPVDVYLLTPVPPPEEIRYLLP